MKMMKAAVVHAFGKPLRIEEVPVPEVAPGQVLVKVAASGVCHTDLHAADGDWPVKPRRPSFPATRASATWRRSAPASSTEGRRPRRRALAAHRLRPLRALHHRLGDAVRRAADDRLHRQRRLRRIRAGRPGLRRPPAGEHRLRRDRADPVRRRDGLQGPEGARLQARRLGGDLRRRRARPPARCSTPRRWASTWSRSTSTTPSWRWRPASAPTWSSTPATADPAKEMQRTLRGAHGVLVTAVSRTAFAQALGMLHKRGTMSLVGLPPGDFALPIFDVVLNAKTVRGSIVGTRKDLQEALDVRGRGQGAHRLQRGSARQHQRDLRPPAQGRDRGPGRAAHRPTSNGR